MKSISWNNKTVVEQGCYRGIPILDYHRADLCDAPSVSSKILRAIISESPRHAFEKSSLNPDRDVDETENQAMALGRLLHSAVAGEVGGETFESDTIMRPATVAGHAYNGNRKEWREWYAEKRAAGLTVITPEMGTKLKGMILALGQFPLVQQGILGAAPERSLIIKDPRGFWIKARPDEVANDDGDYVDLKTTHSILYKDTQRTIINHGYAQQGALVLQAARALGLPASTFTLLWIENKRPFCVRAQTLKDEDLARGHALNQLALKIFWECYQTGVWPGPGDDRADAEYVELPDWWRKSVDDRIKFELREAA
jgi:hypothetical protein